MKSNVVFFYESKVHLLYFTGEKELTKVWSKKDTQFLFHARKKLEKDFCGAMSHK